MENESVWDSIVRAFEDLIDQVIDATPRILAAIAVMFVGMLIAKLLSTITKRVINWVERNKYVATALATAGLAGRLSRLAGKFVYWVVFVIFFSTAVRVLEVPALGETLDGIVAYTPQLFAAAFVFAVAYLGSVVLRDLVSSTLKEVRFPAHNAVGIVVQTIVLIFGVVTASVQLGMDLALVTNNITVIVGGIALALALAFGLGGRKLAGSYVTGMATRSQLEVGQQLSVDGAKAKIKAINNMSVTLETSNGDVVVSYDSLVR